MLENVGIAQWFKYPTLTHLLRCGLMLRFNFALVGSIFCDPAIGLGSINGFFSSWLCFFSPLSSHPNTTLLLNQPGAIFFILWKKNNYSGEWSVLLRSVRWNMYLCPVGSTFQRFKNIRRAFGKEMNFIRRFTSLMFSKKKHLSLDL